MNTQLFLQQAYELVKDEENITANLANMSAFLNEIIPDINWVGFYLVDNHELILGPFQGKVACLRIPIGQGVCVVKQLYYIKQYVSQMYINLVVTLLVIVVVKVRLLFL